MAAPACGFVATWSPAGVPSGGAGQPSRRRPAGAGHAPVHPVVNDRGVPQLLVACPRLAAVRCCDPL